MADTNFTFITGFVTRDPSLRYTGRAVAVMNFTLAVNPPQPTDGPKRETVFVNCVAWGRTAEAMAYHNDIVKKGRKLLVQGRLEANDYTQPADENNPEVQVRSFQLNCWSVGPDVVNMDALEDEHPQITDESAFDSHVEDGASAEAPV